MVTGWRHIWSWRMYQIDPPIVECYIAGQWDVSKERKMILTLENHSYIRQLFQELLKHSQASVGHIRWLFFINQGLTNSVHSVLQLCQFILVYAKKFKSLSIYVCLFPHCILLFLNWVSLVLLVFFFSQQILIIVLFCEVFFTIEIEKSITLPCMKLRMTGISLRVWCRTLRT